MNLLKTTYLTFALLLLSKGASAQLVKVSELPLSFAYYGENAFHPGIKIGTYKTLWSTEKTKVHKFKGLENKHGSKVKLREINLDLNGGFYSHPNNHTGYFINTGLTFLRTNMRKRRQIGVSFEVGYLRRANKFKTYELNEDGTIREVFGAGNNAISFGLAPQFGREFMINDKPVRIYCKPIFQMLQYGHSWAPNANIEVGAVINIHRNK